MLYYKRFISYIKRRGGYITLAQAQQICRCDYRQAKEYIDKAVEQCEIVLENDPYYRVLPGEETRKRHFEGIIKNFKAREGMYAVEEREKEEAVLNDVKRFVEEQGSATIPQIQLKFNFRYGEAARSVNKLIEYGWLELGDGLGYYYIFENDSDDNMPERRSFTPYRKNEKPSDSMCRFLMRGRRRFEEDGARKAAPERDVLKENAELTKVIKKYITNERVVTIPQIQQKFQLKYGVVYKIMNALVKNKFVVMTDELKYQIIISKSEGGANG